MNTLQMKISLLGYIATFFIPILVLKAQEPVDFVQDVKPILELNCVSCHREDKAKGKLRLDTAAEAFKSDDVIVKGKPEESSLYYLTTFPVDDDEIMPPQDSPEQSYPLPKFEQDILKRWIAEGAKWPEGHSHAS